MQHHTDNHIESFNQFSLDVFQTKGCMSTMHTHAYSSGQLHNCQTALKLQIGQEILQMEYEPYC